MNLCIFGQATGGNAALWFDFLNRHLGGFPELDSLTLLCRTPCTLEARFPTVRPYGSGNIPPAVYRFYAPWVKRVGLRLAARRLARRRSFDVLHLQGNYFPGMNRMVVDTFRKPFVLNIYGSDFYQNLLGGKFNRSDTERFHELVERADAVTCNWPTTEHDFLKHFPNARGKCETVVWGVGESWYRPAPPLSGWPPAEKVFLSARGLYDYNNVDLVAEAFCRAFASKPGYKLFIVNGYGNHPGAVQKVRDVVARHRAEDRVILKVGRWIPDEELIALYQRADYNINFGASDQLSVSIIYGLIQKAANILSPLPNYTDLQAFGYRSLRIIPELSADALEQHFRESLEVPGDDIEADARRACEQFDMHAAFRRYLDLYRSLSPASGP